MSISALVWALMAVVLFGLSFKRPVWAIALYMQTFFAAPQLWWWGREIPQARWALWAGCLLLVAMAIYKMQSPDDEGHRRSGVQKAAILMVVNATLVHFIIAVDRTISADTYTELLKYVLLFFLMWQGIRDKQDFRIALMAITLGGFYIGWEVTINERGDFNGSRLEGVGAPGADNANSLADLMLAILPLAAALFVHGTWKNKLVAAIAAPLILNVLLECNSRGAFLGLAGTGAAFLLVSRGTTRKKALRALALGTVALFLLLGDPKILDRFQTTFVGSEERDASAESRLLFWQAGLLMVKDYPLGAGGGAFKFNLGVRYQAMVVGDEDVSDRSLHNGYLTEATDWGIQGLVLKLTFVILALMAAYRTMERNRKAALVDDALTGLCVITAGIGLLIHCLFGSFLANEWTYWLAAILVRYSELYAPSAAAVALPEGTLALEGGPRAA